MGFNCRIIVVIHTNIFRKGSIQFEFYFEKKKNDYSIFWYINFIVRESTIISNIIYDLIFFFLIQIDILNRL